MPDYDSLKILFSSHYSDDYIRVPAFSSNQVNCGPYCKDQHDGSRCVSLQTPVGQYDIQTIIERLPDKQKPELLIVKADATRGNHPYGIGKLKIPTVLILGDTQHMNQPIQSVLQYASDENYDFYVNDHKRHHLHFFEESNIKTYWFPGLLVRNWDIPFQSERPIKLSFVGQAGRFHFYRKAILEELASNGYPLQSFQGPQRDASIIYAKSQITLNISLNGDVNLRVFEVLCAGGFLITDRTSPQSGLELLFRDHEHLVLFEDYKDLTAKIQFFLQNPNEALSIARRGYNEFWAHHNPEIKREQLLDLIFKGEFPPLYSGDLDKRSTYFPRSNKIKLTGRIKIYEHLQHIHSINTGLKVVFTSPSDQQILSDLIDLPRINLFLLGNQIASLTDAIGDFQINVLKNKEELEKLGPFHILLTDCYSIEDDDTIQLIMDIEFQQILITDFSSNSNESQTESIEQLVNLGYNRSEESGLIIYNRKT